MELNHVTKQPQVLMGLWKADELNVLLLRLLLLRKMWKCILIWITYIGIFHLWTVTNINDDEYFYSKVNISSQPLNKQQLICLVISGKQHHYPARQEQTKSSL